MTKQGDNKMKIQKGSKIYTVYLVDDGTLDTVFTVNGYEIRYDSEYVRDEKGVFLASFEQAVNDYINDESLKEFESWVILKSFTY